MVKTRQVRYQLIGEGNGFISPHAVIGEPPEHRDFRWQALNGHTQFWYWPVIHSSAIVEAFVSIDGGLSRSTRIGEMSLIMKHSHIGHDAQIGDRCNVAPGAIIGGHCVLGNGVKVGLGASLRPRIVVGDEAIIGAGAVVVKDVPPGETWAGNPARRIENKKPRLWSQDEEYDAWIEWYERWHP